MNKSKSIVLVLILPLLIAAALVAIGRAPAASAAGATITVSTLGDSGAGSLRQAIADAGPADTITFDAGLSGGMINLGSVLTVDSSKLALTIAANVPITISGNNATRIFEIQASGRLTLQGVTLANGKIASNSVGNRGGAILNSGTLIINQSTLHSNRAVDEGLSMPDVPDSRGGAIYNGGSLTIINSTLHSNTANFGAAVYNNGTAVVRNSTIADNYGGAAIVNDTLNATDAFTVQNSILTNNGQTPPPDGGGGSCADPLDLYCECNPSPNPVCGGGGFGGFSTVAMQSMATTSSSAELNCFNSIVDGGNNIENGVLCLFKASNGSASSTDPKLGARVGAPAYYPLQSGSPALDGVMINAPNGCPTVDQRNASRPQGPWCDIGAYEAPVTPPPACTGDALTVTNTDNTGAGSLRDALTYVCAGGTITIDPALSGGTINLGTPGTPCDPLDPFCTPTPGTGEQLVINKSVTITSSVPISVSGVDGARILLINSGDVRLHGLKLTNGRNDTGAAVFIAPTARVTMTQVSVARSAGASSLYVAGRLTFDGGAVQNGGPMRVVNGGTAVIRNATLADNNSSEAGGGLRLESGATVSVSASEIRNNASLGNGGGIANLGGQLTLTNVTIRQNTANSDVGGGGGVYNSPTAQLTVNGAAFIGNNAPAGSGGGLLSWRDSEALATTVSLTNVTFSGNSAGGRGGAIDTRQGIAITNATFANNSGEGADLAQQNGSSQVKNSIFGPTAAGANCYVSGGAIGNGGNNLDNGSSCGFAAADGSRSNTDPLLEPLTASAPFYHPLNGLSVAIDGVTFNAATACPATDQIGTTRPKGDACDIGAIEDAFACTGAALTVTSNASSGPGTLREALANICVGGTISFAPALDGATINIAPDGLLQTTRVMTITGNTPNLITISGNNSSPILTVGRRTLTVQNLIFSSGRRASGNGGAVTVNPGAHLILNNSQVHASFAQQDGGGIYVSGGGGRLTMTGGAIFNNQATYGAGVYLPAGATAVVTNVSISSNSAGQYGGGFYTNGAFTLNNSAVADNSAATWGGGFYSSAPTALTNVTLSGNSASQGGAAYVYENSADLNHVTVSGNSTSSGSSLYSGGGIRLRNSIIAGQTLGGNCGGPGGFTDQNNNIEDANTCRLIGASSVNTNPLLAARTGSPAYYPLQAASPAINGVLYNRPNECAATDQLGAGRPADAICDIGAVEYAPVCTLNSLVVTSAASWGANTLRSAAENSDLCPGGVITFDPGISTITLAAGDGPILVDRSVTIQGAGQVTVSGGDATQLFQARRGRLTLDRLTLTNGKATGDGGAIHVGSRAELVALDSTIRNSVASGNGGGIYSSGFTRLERTTLRDNRAVRGGGLYASAWGATVINSTLTGNQASDRGGGISANTELTLINSAIVGNTGSGGNGVQANQRVYFYNTIVAGNGTENCAHTSTAVESHLVNRGNNIDDGDTCQFGWNDGSFSRTDPQLGSLTGSPAYFPPAANSPAINSVAYNAPNNCPATDQAGNPRPQDGRCDSGPVETTLPACTVSSYTVTSAAGSGAGSLREGLAQVCAGGAITMDPALSGRVINLAGSGGQLTVYRSVGITSTVPITVSGGDATRAFYVLGETVTMSGLAVTNGRALNNVGGNFFIGGGAGLTFTQGVVANGRALDGGGIFVASNGKLLIRSSTLRGNTADRDGGGVYSANASNADIAESAILENQAVGHGGAMDNGGTANLTNVTVTKNNPGFRNRNTGKVELRHLTFMLNNRYALHNPYDNGQDSSGYTYLTNSVVAETQNGNNCYGKYRGGNSVTSDDSCWDTNDDPTRFGPHANMAFSPLTGNPPYYVVQVGDYNTSRGIPAGACTTRIDQRGEPRGEGEPCDFGAIEAPSMSSPLLCSWRVYTTDSAGSGSLRAAIQNAKCTSGPTLITFDPGLYGQTFDISADGPLYVVQNAIISATQPITLTGNNLSSILQVWAKDAPSITVEVSNVNFSNGNNGVYTPPVAQDLPYPSPNPPRGAMISDVNTLKGMARGGAIYVDSLSPAYPSTLILNNCTVSGSTAQLAAGDDRPYKRDGGAIYVAGTLVMNGGALRHNTAQQDGGAVWLGGNGIATLNDVAVHNNQAQREGGGLYGSDGSNLTINRGAVHTNQAQQEGGGLSARRASVSGSDVYNNQAQDGGGLFLAGAAHLSSITNATIRDNQATGRGGRGGRGGGLYVTGRANLNNSHIWSNTAQQGGGAYYQGAQFSMTGGTIADNNVGAAADQTGGGIHAQLLHGADGLSLASVSIARNQGAGLLAEALSHQAPTVYLHNVTFTAGKTPGLPGLSLRGFYDSDTKFDGPARAEIRNSLFLTDGASAGCVELPTPFWSGNYRLVAFQDQGNNMDQGSSCGFSSANGSWSNTDPGVLFPANYGAANKYQYSLTYTSPVLEAVRFNEPNGCPATDAWGNSRPQGVYCDVGALEAVCGNPVVTSLASSGAGSLRDAILQTCVNGRVTFASALRGGTINVNPDGPLSIARNIEISSTVPITVSGNNATPVFAITGSPYATLRGFTIANGQSATNGGGVQVGPDARLTLQNMILRDNAAQRGGAAYALGWLTVVDSVLQNNTATQMGGAIYAEEDGLIIERSELHNNSAPNGGAVALWQINANIADSVLRNNRATGATGYGGAIFLSRGSVTKSELTLVNSLLRDNQAQTGGALYSWGSSGSVRNATFSGNTAVADGGAVALLTAGGPAASEMWFINNTFGGNTAGGSGSSLFVFQAPSQAFVRNSILADGAANCAPSAGGVISNQFNNIDSGSSCGFGSALGSRSSLDPQVAPLANNGGRTLTYALLPTSPALDGVTHEPATSACPATDARGTARPQGAACDIGAYEGGTKVCGLTAGQTYTFGSSGLRMLVNTAGDLSCAYAEALPLSHPNATGSAEGQNLRTGTYWRINGLGAGAFNVDLTVTVPFTPTAEHKLCRYTGAGQAWDCAATGFDAVNKTITRAGVTGFSDWAVGGSVGPTAVALRSLSAVRLGGLGQFAAWLALLLLGGVALYRYLLARQ